MWRILGSLSSMSPRDCTRSSRSVNSARLSWEQLALRAAPGDLLAELTIELPEVALDLAEVREQAARGLRELLVAVPLGTFRLSARGRRGTWTGWAGWTTGAGTVTCSGTPISQPSTRSVTDGGWLAAHVRCRRRLGLGAGASQRRGPGLCRWASPRHAPTCGVGPQSRRLPRIPPVSGFPPGLRALLPASTIATWTAVAPLVPAGGYLAGGPRSRCIYCTASAATSTSFSPSAFDPEALAEILERAGAFVPVHQSRHRRKPIRRATVRSAPGTKPGFRIPGKHHDHHRDPRSDRGYRHGDCPNGWRAG